MRSNTLIFLVEKMREAFAVEKLLYCKSFSHFFFNKNIGIFQMLTFEIITKR